MATVYLALRLDWLFQSFDGVLIDDELHEFADGDGGFEVAVAHFIESGVVIVVERDWLPVPFAVGLEVTKANVIATYKSLEAMGLIRISREDRKHNDGLIFEVTSGGIVSNTQGGIAGNTHNRRENNRRETRKTVDNNQTTGIVSSENVSLSSSSSPEATTDPDIFQLLRSVLSTLEIAQHDEVKLHKQATKLQDARDQAAISSETFAMYVTDAALATAEAARLKSIGDRYHYFLGTLTNKLKERPSDESQGDDSVDYLSSEFRHLYK
jgi:site-specific DNA-cytosine methylase